MRGILDQALRLAVAAVAVAAFSPLARADQGDGLRPGDVETVVVRATPHPSDYKLGAGDKVRVTVYGEDDLSGEFQVDGSGYVRFVARVLFPLIKPALASVIVLHSIGIWNEYVIPLIYLPKKSLMPITRGLMVFYGQFGNDWTTLAAAILMLTLPIAALFLVLQRWIYAGVLQGSVRG